MPSRARTPPRHGCPAHPRPALFKCPARRGACIQGLGREADRRASSADRNVAPSLTILGFLGLCARSLLYCASLWRIFSGILCVCLYQLELGPSVLWYDPKLPCSGVVDWVQPWSASCRGAWSAERSVHSGDAAVTCADASQVARRLGATSIWV
ncbi:hypothetical protein CONLIGDRAFT_332275 [Coniochaeta ligniaria NRRL 30616]|uniref:Uncharacterized protein n=1 Tax=Coniochaeta ligniaria NRRL 30616 TaxID=1408157 RepID=A0A1J7J8B4_9PEZI|nr:hypothetical protein CONLIGDRAFT_332275 [Coniochaeta ligniaria NRRL 30616]